MEVLIIHIFPAIVLGFVIQVLLHEMGHFMGGIITGWRLLFIQVYCFVIKRTDKGLKIIVVNDRGFQCIMYPKAVNTKALLYTMGGCVVNLVLALMGFVLIFAFNVSPLMWLYIWCFSVFGMGLYIVNGTSSIKRVCNDKACYNLLRSNSPVRLCHNAQLLIAKQLMGGLTFRQIGSEIICLCPDIAENDIEAYHSVLEYYYYLDLGSFMKMGQALNKVRNKDNISREVLDIIEMELVYVRLLCAIKIYMKRVCENSFSGPFVKSGNCDALVINEELDIIKRYGKKRNAHTIRVLAVYEAYLQFIEGNSRGAIKLLKKAINELQKPRYVYEGEKIFCEKQLSQIKELMETEIRFVENRKLNIV